MWAARFGRPRSLWLHAWWRLLRFELEEDKRAIHDVADLSRGALRVAVTPTFTTYLIGPLVEAFHRRHPNITLTLREIAQEHMEALLLADELDVGIAFDPVHAQDIAAQRLLVESLALVVGEAPPLAKHRRVSRQALDAESLVLLSGEFATREQIDRYFREQGVRPRVAMEANAIGAVIEVVRRTTLSTLLPANLANAHADLTALDLEPLHLQRTAVLMQRKGAYQTAAARAFIEVAMQVATALQEV